ncbi:Protein fmp52, mitochondrial [Saxophila tyrrhenica]|uniref:Protein fmp52, mitochondrial n=1 Tax=Saxophila tyrrhenica TaxID=1690608 RepID=A0AAV9NVM2_9PEZI|nr:Protein fmp52, mitochondrial [Saxophila tyrrhenica]
MATVCLVGSTGLVGSNIYTVLSKHPHFNTIYAYSRKDLPISEKLKPLVSKDTSSWPSQFPSGAELFISALGTTRGAAGGFENQRKIDYDLNLELAKAAKEAGTKHYVLISSTGASASSSLGYPKMKGELEEAVKALDFDHLVVLRPGLLVGNRNESRFGEMVFRKIAAGAGAISGNRLKDFWAQDADVVAKAAVRAGLDCMEGKQEEKFRLLGQADVVRLGRTEWKD